MKRRIFLVVGVASALLLGLGGCDLYAPQETEHITETSDGVSGTTGTIFVGNAVIVTTDGKVGNLVATLINSDESSHNVAIRDGSSGQELTIVTVGPAESVQVGSPDGETAVLTGLDAIPGSLFPVSFTSGDSSEAALDVPVLTNAIPQYSTLTPAPEAG